MGNLGEIWEESGGIFGGKALKDIILHQKTLFYVKKRYFAKKTLLYAKILLLSINKWYIFIEKRFHTNLLNITGLIMLLGPYEAPWGLRLLGALGSLGPCKCLAPYEALKRLMVMLFFLFF